MPINDRFRWSWPYSYHPYSVLLGGSAGFLLGVIVCTLWWPKKLPGLGSARTAITWVSAALFTVLLLTQFHMAEHQFGEENRLEAGFDNALAPILTAWSQTQSVPATETEQSVAVQLMQAQASLMDISDQLGDDGFYNTQTLADYLGKIGYDMLNQQMTTTETSEFNAFVKMAGPYLNQHVAHGISLTPRNVQAVMNTLYSDLPADEK